MYVRVVAPNTSTSTPNLKLEHPNSKIQKSIKNLYRKPYRTNPYTKPFTAIFKNHKITLLLNSTHLKPLP